MAVGLNDEMREAFWSDYDPEKVTVDEQPTNPQPALDYASRLEPDKEAQIRKIQQRLPGNPSNIRADLPEYERMNTLAETQEKLQGSPRTQQYLSDPQNAAVAYDDVDVLTALEERMENPPQPDRGFVGGLMRSFEGWGSEAMIRLGKRWDELKAAEAGRYLDWGKDTVLGAGENPFEPGSGAYAMFALGAGIREQSIEQNEQVLRESLASAGVAQEEIARLTPDDLNVVQEGIRGSAQMVFDAASMMGFTVVSRGQFNPLLPYLSGSVYLENYATARNMGRDHDNAAKYAGVSAGIEYVTEKIPTMYLEKYFGDILKGGGVKADLTNFVLGDLAGENAAALAETVNNIAFDMGGEIQEAWENGDYAKMALLQGEQQLIASIATAGGSGTMALAGRGLNALANRQSSADKHLNKVMNDTLRAESEQKQIEDLTFLAQSSKLMGRSSEQFEAFVNTLPQDQQVYIDREAASQLEDAPEFITAALAQEDGDVDIVMPVGTFLRYVRDEEANIDSLKPHIRLNRDSVSAAEVDSTDNDAVLKNMMDKAQKNQETLQEIDRVYEQVKDQIIATGRMSTPTATQAAEIIKAYVATTHDRLNRRGIEKSVTEIFEGFGLKIKGPSERQPGQFLNERDATEYALAEAKGLDLSEEARAERGRAMGFDMDTVYYHGTASTQDGQDFTDFRYGADGLRVNRPFTFFTTDPTYADFYLTKVDTETGKMTMDGGRVIPARLRLGKVFDYETMTQADGVSLQESLQRFYNNPRQEKLLELKHGSKVLMEGLEAAKELEINTILNSVENGEWGAIESAGVQQWIREQAFDSFYTQEAGRKNIAVLNPNQIRSVNAAFDPDRSDSPKILAQASAAQDFEGLTFEDTYVDDAGNTIAVEIDAQAAWDANQQRLKMLQMLRECMSG